MSTARELKLDIIEMLVEVDDIGMLESIRHQLEVVHKAKELEEKPSFLEAVTTIRENVSLEEIMAEQNYKPITYQEFRAKADKLEWEESLDELLEALKR